MSTLAEHQFRCSVCLELLTDPVSTPCGHNFCKTCLETYWDSWDVCRCPLCKEEFYKRPELRINTSFREVVEFFKNKNTKKQPMMMPGLAARMAKPGEVPCDVCVQGLQFKALKSCLVCMASYCEAHLEPHRTAAALSKHKLIEPVMRLEERMCSAHSKILEWFCRKEEQLICQFCAETEHSRHQVVTVETEVQLKMLQIKRREREVELMIKDRHKRVEEINCFMERSRDIAQKEMESSVQAFSALMVSLEQTHTTLMAEMEARHDAVQRRFEGFVRELQEEISVLEKKYAELEQLLQVKDHMSLLQDYSQIRAPESLQNWSAIPVYEVDFLGCIRAALGKAREFVNLEMENQAATELSKIQRFAEDITIDPDTAGPWLVVSEDGKEVRQSPKKQKVPASPLRFTENLCALATRGFNMGRHYWEVAVREKSNWALGVASSTVNRREYVTPSPEKGLWAMGHRDGKQYVVFSKKPVAISLSPRPKTIGVFVDYDEGKVAFYNVEAKAHIFTYNNCCFKDKIYPTFDPALTAERKETAPLQIMTVEISK